MYHLILLDLHHIWMTFLLYIKGSSFLDHHHNLPTCCITPMCTYLLQLIMWTIYLLISQCLYMVHMPANQKINKARGWNVIPFMHLYLFGKACIPRVTLTSYSWFGWYIYIYIWWPYFSVDAFVNGINSSRMS